MPELRESGIDALRKIPRILIFALVLISSGALVQTVNTRRTIRVVMDNNYAPYAFQSDQGKLQGILIDQWKEWEKKTGIKVGRALKISYGCLINLFKQKFRFY